MKSKTTFTFVTLLILSILRNNSFAQNFNAGLGFTFEYPQDIKYERMNGVLKLHKLYIPVTLFNKIRIIPEIAYWDFEYKLDDNSVKYSILHTGIGIYYLVPLDSTNIYIGPRISTLNIKNPSKNQPPNIITSKIDRTYGATFGAEYNLTKNLSLGFEIQYNYYEVKPWTNFGYEGTTIKRAIETIFVFVFHL